MGMQQAARPNILFILVDDMGWMDLGCQGSRFYETPVLDQLAREGMRFTDAYAACPVCSPTRASLMSGKSGFLSHLFGGRRIAVASGAASGRRQLYAAAALGAMGPGADILALSPLRQSRRHPLFRDARRTMETHCVF